MAGIIIKMLVLCAGWEIARGIVFSSLGSSALCVPMPCFVLFGFSFYASSPVLLQICNIRPMLEITHISTSEYVFEFVMVVGRTGP
uniref:Uncharacterized protein n=1 Tax=Zea mays TaxID=4577 RepID=B6T203_MAIZE|nr:hypothetical protein [Zea mays]